MEVSTSRSPTPPRIPRLASPPSPTEYPMFRGGVSGAQSRVVQSVSKSTSTSSCTGRTKVATSPSNSWVLYVSLFLLHCYLSFFSSYVFSFNSCFSFSLRSTVVPRRRPQPPSQQLHQPL